MYKQVDSIDVQVSVQSNTSGPQKSTRKSSVLEFIGTVWGQSINRIIKGNKPCNQTSVTSILFQGI